MEFTAKRVINDQLGDGIVLKESGSMIKVRLLSNHFESWENKKNWRLASEEDIIAFDKEQKRKENIKSVKTVAFYVLVLSVFIVSLVAGVIAILRNPLFIPEILGACIFILVLFLVIDWLNPFKK